MSKHKGAAAVVRGAHSIPVHQTHRPGTHRTRRWAWWWIPLVGLVFLAGGGLAVVLSGGITPTPGGTLAAARTQYDFGPVPINGGVITTQFPLTVNGDALVTDITTT
jgi:hypothetical protein